MAAEPVETDTLNQQDASTTSASHDVQKKRGFLASITMEPVTAAAMMAICLAQTPFQNLYLQTACRVDLNISSAVCTAGSGDVFKAAEIASQTLVTQTNVMRGFVSTLISTFMLVFLGPWSDSSGRRKPLILLSLGCINITYFMAMVLQFFPNLSIVYVVYAISLPMSLGGHFGVFITGLFAYIGDLCHATGRDLTYTMGTNRAAMQIAAVLGSTLGPVLYTYIGFFGVFLLSFTLQLFSLAYVYAMMTDINVNANCRMNVFNVKLPYQAARRLFRRRDGNKRRVVMLMLVVGVMDRVVMSGDMQLSYLYFRNKFGWTDILYGLHMSYRSIIHFIGTLLVLKVIKGVMKMRDELVGVMGGVAGAAGHIALALARSTPFAFLAPVIGILDQGVSVVNRPILNRQIDTSEQGQIYAIMGAGETAVQMITGPLYNLLYKATLTTFPDAFVMVEAAGQLLQASMFISVILVSRSTRGEEKPPRQDDDRGYKFEPVIQNCSEVVS